LAANALFHLFSLQDTVMLGADYYETDPEREELLAEGKVPIGIGENTTIQYASIFYYVAMAHF